jgi:restriction system protein
VGPAQAWLLAALAWPLGAALLARMVPWPAMRLAVLGLAAFVVLYAGLSWLLARRAPVDLLASAQRLGELSPLAFERYVATWFRARGYRVQHCGGRGDGGADLRVWRHGRAAIVQCKRYGPAHAVGPAVIRELVGTRALHGVRHAWLATTGRLTAGARALAQAEGIRVVDAPMLAALPAHRPLWRRVGQIRAITVSDAGMRLAEGDGESP